MGAVTGLERGIGEVFAAFETWLVSTGATDSLMRLAWAVLSVVWLGHVAVSTGPGRDFDLIGAFARLFVAGGLLSGIGGLTRVILLGFETFRSAGAAVLNGLIGQSWGEFVRDVLQPQFGQLLTVSPAWFAYPWAAAVLLVGALLGFLFFAFGTAVYLSILFFAHLTLLLAIFLSPLAAALLAAPGTQGWTFRWAVIVVRVGLLVFCVRVIHAAALYLSVIVPFRDAVGALAAPDAGPFGLALLLWRLTALLFVMLVGTAIGVYAMLHVERLIGQFVGGPLVESAARGPVWAGRQAADMYSRYSRAVYRAPGPNVAAAGAGPPEGNGGGGSRSGGAQDATVLRGHRRFWQ